MRSRDEVLREFQCHTLDPNSEEFENIAAMADRIRELEAAIGEPVAWWCVVNRNGHAYVDHASMSRTEVEEEAAELDREHATHAPHRVSRVLVADAPPSAAGVADAERRVVECAERWRELEQKYDEMESGALVVTQEERDARFRAGIALNELRVAVRVLDAVKTNHNKEN